MSQTNEMTPHHSAGGKSGFILALAALGIVFGDLGTSPLYALQEAFQGNYGVLPTPSNVIGIVSLFLWSLLLMVSVKYVFVLMLGTIAVVLIFPSSSQLAAAFGLAVSTTIHKNETDASVRYHIPPNRVVEMGARMELLEH